MTQCIAKTKVGTLCQIPAREGQKYCHIHRRQFVWHRIFSGLGIGALGLGFLGFIANVTGVLGYFGINPPNLQSNTSLSISDFKVGIIPGHVENGSGEICVDDLGRVTLTESDVNQKISESVKDNLVSEGYSAQVFSDFDQRLIDYQALAILVVHTDSCQYINDYATGFKLAQALSQQDDKTRQEKDESLISCLKQNYAFVTGLQYHESQTADMTVYNSFSEVRNTTPVVIIDAGFLNLDRDLLTEHTNLVAKGITEGMKCYFRYEGVSLLDAVSINIIWSGDKINEHILIENHSPTALSLMGWIMQDEHGNKFSFPNIILDSQSSVRVYTQKKGVNSNSELFWEIGNVKWVSGDGITLIDTKGIIRDLKRIL